ncbi:NAD(P)/FAD-dependent oxidoreductase [Halolamina salifodinae]|uniref:Sarcosine oxidase subunit beta n=1 Tax=Halolamina salifodinae TaxID=1202767 RepID=A0A8T4GUW5_9EURY|nr:FAD-dependent oxidoreductase [Halolamina salifodinae]MBP1986827.1 sarcosine oxidase subunit beta [Halolamina salifodinae]
MTNEYGGDPENVVVVGGGIIGLASAYYLEQRGADVTVLEKSSIGAGNTGRANGGIRAQFTSPVSSALSKESIEVWESFDEQFGVDIKYRRPGYLFLARTESTAEQFRENVAKQNEQDIPSRFVTPQEAKELCPGLYHEEFVGGTYCPIDGIADPHLALQGFSDAARESGAEIRTKTKVVDVLQNGSGEVTGVETEAETIPADFVVNAAGAWAKQVGKMVDIDLPVDPKRRKLMVVDPEEPVSEDVPFTVDSDHGFHFRPERKGAAVAGGHFSDADPEEDPDDFSTSTSIDWAAEVIERGAEVASYFGPETRVNQGWAGLYAVTPDHHPILEETIPGFINAVGFSGHGFMQSPATGQIVAEIVTNGSPSLVDVSSLTADRFANGGHLREGTVID